MKILFVCSHNRLHSPTAEASFDGEGGHQLGFVGTEQGARIRVSADHIGWPDVTFVMEKRHRDRLAEKFRTGLADKQVICPHIPDDYEYMDEELIEGRRGGVAPHVDFGDSAS